MASKINWKIETLNAVTARVISAPAGVMSDTRITCHYVLAYTNNAGVKQLNFNLKLLFNGYSVCYKK